MNLRGDKVYLSNDIPFEALDFRNDYNVYKFCRQYTLISTYEHEAYLNKLKTDKSIKLYGIMKINTDDFSSSDKPIGVCGFTSIDKHNQSAEFSLYIHPKYRGKGYAREALFILIKHGFLDHNFNRIWGEVFDFNIVGMNLFKSVGFKEEGVLRQSYYRNGRFVDSYIISVVRNEFGDS